MLRPGPKHSEGRSQIVVKTHGGSENRSLLVSFQKILLQVAEDAALTWVWRVSVCGMTLEEHLNSLKAVARDTSHQHRDPFSKKISLNENVSALAS